MPLGERKKNNYFFTCIYIYIHMYMFLKQERPKMYDFKGFFLVVRKNTFQYFKNILGKISKF